MQTVIARPREARDIRLICVAGCLLAILFLASQNRVFGVFAHCPAPRPLVLSIGRGGC